MVAKAEKTKGEDEQRTRLLVAGVHQVLQGSVCVFVGNSCSISLLPGQLTGNFSLAVLGGDVRVLLVHKVCCFLSLVNWGRKIPQGLKPSRGGVPYNTEA